ncbi:acyl-[ACP]--phospholipid O-acyltransferase [Marinibactrum halimedae]|uniref:Acyl-[ACP]--phospholipid O-acyltransferase n=1 Tax=Marinibactrum halimedae TaxID=1444977 RepID=A0AA37WNB3_9GAMM|nr:acyl-[ACP]--phospholipid O-acyltransferase [Marinibactrum halimedae]MCD9460233.1 MFS transporter [Marinibactrum halimedae]GLS27934.1 acyl-[ACP]--phospholipid O-acyltransferase [Marinibactrum halimedae]
MPRLLDFKGFLPFVTIVFLNAFVDLGHKILIQNTIFKVYDGSTQVVLTAIINAFILLPFILLFSPSGFISDKYPKHRVMQLSAAAAVVITLLITVCYYSGWFWAAFGLTLALAVQSAIYSPAKYGYIRELVGKEPLARANGAVQAITITGILLGTFVFSGFFEFLIPKPLIQDTSNIMTHVAPVGWLLVALSVVEFVLSQKLPEKSQLDESKTFSIQSYANLTYLKRNLSTLTGRRSIWEAIIGLATFWAISQVLLATFPAFAKEVLAETNTLKIQGILACSGLGIIIGSTIAGRMSKRHIETGLIPVGAAGITILLLVIPTLGSLTSMALAFLLVGVMGGMFIVPLNALIQYNAHEEEMGTVLAGNNWIQNVSMLGFLFLTIALAALNVPSQYIIALLAVVAFFGAGHTVRRLPHSCARIVAGTFFRQRYRIQVEGFRNLPATGGVLLLGNHISWIDWALVQIASPRPVNFVMLRAIYQHPVLKPILRMFNVIPIAKGYSEQALETVNQRLANGEVVCLFPEGAISRNGQLGKFHTGFERATKGLTDEQAVVVPFYLHGLWGSRFSRSTPKLREARAPVGRRRDLIVAFGKPLPISTTATELKPKVFELSISAWEEYTSALPTLAEQWLMTARRFSRSTAALDYDGEHVSYRKLLVLSLLVARSLSGRYRGKGDSTGQASKPASIGILLPSSCANLCANFGALLSQEVVVNINPHLDTHFTIQSLKEAGVTMVLSSDQYLEQLQEKGISLAPLQEAFVFSNIEDLIGRFRPTSFWLIDAISRIMPNPLLLRMFSGNFFDPLPSPNDTAVIIHTSGSESAPKGVQLSHRNVLTNCKQVSDVLNVQEEDSILANIPPFHAFGFTVTTLMPLLEGIPVVCQADPTNTLEHAKAIARHQVSLLFSTDLLLHKLSFNEKIDPLMLQSLRAVISGSDKLRPHTREAFQKKFNKVIYEGYGCTETSPVISVNIPNVLDLHSWQVQFGNREETVGLPLPGTSVRIVDPESYSPLAAGEEGLITVAGNQVMKDYVSSQEGLPNEKNSEDDVFIYDDDIRWFKTGDYGFLTAEGFLTIVDRQSRFATINDKAISLSHLEEATSVAIDRVLAKFGNPTENKADPNYQIVALTHASATQQHQDEIVILIESNIDYTAFHDDNEETSEATSSLREFCEEIKKDMPSESDTFHRLQHVKRIPRLGNGKVDMKSCQSLITDIFEQL